MADYQALPADVPAGPPPPPFALVDLDNSKTKLLEGLTTDRAKEYYEQYGGNFVPEHKEPLWKMFLVQFMGPMPMMIEVAAVMCFLIRSWPDFFIIVSLLLTNATLGFFEEKNAQASVDALKQGLEKKVPVKRDGRNITLNVKEIVPGDILFLRGGDIIPADCYYLEGDPLQIDEAALTGESLPVKVPRKDDAGKPYTGRQMWSGSILKQGECQCIVAYTGVNTMIGEAAKAIQDAAGREIGVFEGKIIAAAQVLIMITIVTVSSLFYYELVVLEADIFDVLEMSLSLVIASVPVALPMVMKVTLSIGAKEMADEGGIVTHLTALEEIASMKVLCSDKTGTLTTAQMTVYYDATAPTWNGLKSEQMLEYAALASNAANKDDPIDAAVLRAYAKSVGCDGPHAVDDAVAKLKQKYEVKEFFGFNPIVKRTVVKVQVGRTQMQISKGMVDVVLKTKAEDEGVQWTVADFEKVSKEAYDKDAELGISGFKTLGVSFSEGSGPMVFAGILPIMDPPRADTAVTIQKIKSAHVGVKMITGDHHNIAKELARQIDLGTDIRSSEDLWPASQARDDMILGADGFAKVKPLDKHEVVSVLQGKGMVVGMTGDGVNDAPALAKAQIGVAVHGATDAAKSAADIVLTRDGLSPIYTAIQISRRIFKRLKSYVIYRICITVQVVGFLACLSFFWNARFKALYIILLALFHDLQIVTIAYDHQVAGPYPETPTVMGLLFQSYAMGILMCVQTLFLCRHGKSFLSNTFADAIADNPDPSVLNPYMESTIFLQISNSSAILILSARTVGFFFQTMPAWQLMLSTAIGQVLVNLALMMPGDFLVSQLEIEDIAKVWLYDILWLLILDIVKMGALRIYNSYKEATMPPEFQEDPVKAMARNSFRKATNSVEPLVPGTAASFRASFKARQDSQQKASMKVQQEKQRTSIKIK
mmetsp:Transcript_31662/g.73946  ORF Transcript_31662/g.73946 Transcript_31662/m.73946 type:complete len:935 (+) Transcript_31662:80-2884(+)